MLLWIQASFFWLFWNDKNPNSYYFWLQTLSKRGRKLWRFEWYDNELPRPFIKIFISNAQVE